MAQIFASAFMVLWALALFVAIFKDGSKNNRQWRPTSKGRMRRMSHEGWQYRDMTTGELSSAKEDFDARQY